MLNLFFLMSRRPPEPTRTGTLFPYTTPCRYSGGGAQRPDDRGDGPRSPRARRSGFPRRSVRGTLAGPQRRSGPPLSRRSEEHTSELQSLMRISYAVLCLKEKSNKHYSTHQSSTYHLNRGTDHTAKPSRI